MTTTANAPQPRLTRVCAEAQTPDDHKGCSGGFCECTCAHPAAPIPIRRAGQGRFGTAPPGVVAELQRLRDARRARREAGEPE